MGNNDYCICINCRQPLSAEWRFCPNCRWQVDSTGCPACGGLVDLRWQYCPGCRSSLDKAESNERRLFINSNKWLNAALGNNDVKS
ncbi:MAG TPA: zinc ribbon domain-containing protein [Desulfobacteria bacterium]|nr:zinc ribbon domain-containing protein [Desulfobacteria bacterium]